MRPDPKDYAPMWLVHGPLTCLAELPYGTDPKPHRFRSKERAERQCERLNRIKPGHKVQYGIGGRAGWRAA